MRLYGALSELASLVIRLASGKTVTVKSAEQQQQDIEVTIPDVGGSTQKEFLMIETTTAQPLRSKTINFAHNTVTPATLNINALTAPSGIGNEVVRLNQATGVIETGLITNANIAASAQIADTKLAKITSANKVDSGAVQAVMGDNGRVLSFDANGAPSAALISNVNIAANAAIEGSKLTNIPAASLSPMTSAQLAGIVTDETGSGALVFANNPTIGSVTAASGILSVLGTGALRLPFGTNAQKPAGVAADLKGMIRYNSETDSFEGYASDTWSGLGGGGTVDRVTQASHGFVVGDVLWLNGSTYAKAKADAANTAEVVGMVSRVIDAGTFELTLSGEVTGLTGLVAGEVYFLSPSTDGAMTITEPSVVGQVSLPVGVASSTTSLYVAPKRGVVVGGANLRTQIGLNGAALVSQTTNIQNVTAYTAGELSGWVYIDATTDRRFYIQVQFVKDAANAWKCAYQTTGDTPPAGFNVDVVVSGPDAFVQVQMPPVAGWLSGSVNFALNAPAVGATLPLQIDGGSVTGPVLGSTSGAAVPAGRVGEVLIAATPTGAVLTSNTYNPVLDLTINTGIWRVDYAVYVNRSGATLTDGTVAIDVSKPGGTFSTVNWGHSSVSSAFTSLGGNDVVVLTSSAIIRSDGVNLIFTNRTESNSQVLRLGVYGGAFSSGASQRGSAYIRATRIA